MIALVRVGLCDAQQRISKLSQLIERADADIFILGETYFDDQPWMEGAYRTAESAPDDILDIKLIEHADYPFIYPCS